MGLDITAVRKATLLEVVDDVEDWEERFNWDETDYAYVNPGFPGWEDNVKDNGVYSYEEDFDFRAGSYSGYNHWRAWLCKTIHGFEPRLIWESESQDWAFYWLINFSDCEGVIGPIKSAKLANDFAAHQEIIDKADAPDEWYKTQYTRWRKAFEMAANNGYVRFH